VIVSATPDGYLELDAPRGFITPDLRKTLAQHKTQVLHALAERQQQAAISAMRRELGRDPDAWREFETQREERAGILEYDANMPRDVAELEAERMTLESWLDMIDCTDRQPA
jgi:hypothetical protein